VPTERGRAPTVVAATHRRLLLGIGVCYLAYFAAILFCDFWRGEELGIRLRYAGREVHVAEVTPGSPAARAGLEAGDRITRLGAVQLRTRLDRFAFHPRLSFHEPVPIRWIRGSAQMQSSIAVTTAQYAFWRTRAGVMLAIMRAMQVGMLVLAFIIDVTRSSAVRRAEYNPAGRVAPCSGSTSGIWTSSLTPVMF
jgi:membrane-associated protease RseP (regulator of RpoE activity)